MERSTFPGKLKLLAKSLVTLDRSFTFPYLHLHEHRDEPRVMFNLIRRELIRPFVYRSIMASAFDEHIDKIIESTRRIVADEKPLVNRYLYLGRTCG
jgi:hypothetical protein